MVLAAAAEEADANDSVGLCGGYWSNDDSGVGVESDASSLLHRGLHRPTFHIASTPCAAARAAAATASLGKISHR